MLRLIAINSGISAKKLSFDFSLDNNYLPVLFSYMYLAWWREFWTATGCESLVGLYHLYRSWRVLLLWYLHTIHYGVKSFRFMASWLWTLLLYIVQAKVHVFDSNIHFITLLLCKKKLVSNHDTVQYFSTRLNNF